MKFSALVAVVVLAGATAADAKPASPQPVRKPYTFVRSVQFDMTSKVNGRHYRIFVHTPPMPPPAGGYPVLFVTDGNGTFPIAAGQAEIDEVSGGRMILVVGIGYPTLDADAPLTLRNRDLTPSPPLADQPGVPPDAKPQDFGGSESFYRFITEEVRPTIAAAYKVNQMDQTLYGHSYGGLFTLGVLFHHPNAFRSFVISSPSIWWNDKEVLKGEAEFSKLVEAGQIAPRILIEVGSLEETLPNPLPAGLTEAEFLRDGPRARMVGNARELAERLSRLKGGPGYIVRTQVFEAESHISVMPASMSRALTFPQRQ